MKIIFEQNEFNTFEKEEFDLAYCLGRSLCHLQTAEEWLLFFDNIRNVLKEKGMLIIDVPDPTKGTYAKNLEEMRGKLNNLGLIEDEKNLILDSPEGKHFCLRSAPTREQMKSFFELMGFEVEEEVARPFGNEGNENMYFVLRKKEIGNIRQSDACNLFLDIDFFSRSGNPYKKYVSWQGLCPAQLCVYGNSLPAVETPKAWIYRDPQTSYLEIEGRR